MRFLRACFYSSSIIGVGHLVYTFYNIIINGYMHIVENNVYILYFEFILMIFLFVNVLREFYKEYLLIEKEVLKC